MNDKNQTIQAVIKEAHRIEEDALHSMKGHFNASNLWEKANLLVGLPSAIIAAWAGLEAIANNSSWAAVLALTSATFTATMTFLKPESVAENHRNSGREFNVLKNNVRRFREIDILHADELTIIKSIENFSKIRDDLNSMSRDIPRWAYNKAKQDIDNGLAHYQIDKETANEC